MSERSTSLAVKSASPAMAGGLLLQRKCTCGAQSHGSRECPGCAKKYAAVQRKSYGPENPDQIPPIVHDVLRSAGTPLDQGVCRFMQSRFGQDFSAVRVHSHAQAHKSADAVNALAYTVGSDIVFNEGQYAPHSAQGRQLLAHELAHVVQQRGGGGVTPGPAQERDADVASFAVVAGKRPAVGERSSVGLATEPMGGSGPRIPIASGPKARTPIASGPKARTPIATGGGPSPRLDQLDPADFESTYNLLTGTYTFLGTQQQNAIQSVYTEAKKPTPPSLVEEILTSLAIMALGFPISILGQRAEKAALDSLLRMVADPAGQENEVLKESARRATDAVKMISKAANDALKDGAKSFTGKYVRDLIKENKLPVDAFFEGLTRAATDTAKRGFVEAEKQRKPTKALGAVYPALPVLVATLMFDAQDATYNGAYDLQREETLTRWLDYQAQSNVGAVIGKPTPTSEEKSITDLNAIRPSQIRNPDTLGIIYVDAYIGKTGGLFPRKGYIPGLSRSMLALIDGKFIKDIGLPIIYRVVSMHDLDGIGVDQPAGPHTAEEDQFAVMVNEVGGIHTSRLYPWHEKALARIAHPGMGGDYSVHAELGWDTPKDLSVKADKN